MTKDASIATFFQKKTINQKIEALFHNPKLLTKKITSLKRDSYEDKAEKYNFFNVDFLIL